MKKRIARCQCLVGWEDSVRMTIPKLCTGRGTHRLTALGVPAVVACIEHVRWNEKKALTYVPRGGPMLIVPKGSGFLALVTR